MLVLRTNPIMVISFLLKFIPDYFLVVVSPDFCVFLLLKYYGGHVASPFIPDDMEFINMAIQATRQDGKPPVPIWVTTEDDLVCVYQTP